MLSKSHCLVEGRSQLLGRAERFCAAAAASAAALLLLALLLSPAQLLLLPGSATPLP